MGLVTNVGRGLNRCNCRARQSSGIAIVRARYSRNELTPVPRISAANPRSVRIPHRVPRASRSRQNLDSAAVFTARGARIRWQPTHRAMATERDACPERALRAPRSTYRPDRLITREADVPAAPEVDDPWLDELVVVTCEVDVPCTVVPEVFVPGTVAPTVFVPGELMRIAGRVTRTTLAAVTPRGT
jgi:hypothetical protein